MDHFLVICVALSIISLGHGHRMCTIDSDCDDLGSLSCVKSGCNWGVCGCKRGYAARFVGSSKGYRCVKMKKIGESCTTDDTTGVCGASNSDCVNGECTCDSGFEARWGGEECLNKQTPYPTETCSASLGAACGGSSSCASNGAWNGAYSGTPVSDLPNSPFDDVPNVCACATGFRTVIPNDYDLGAFVGSKVPTCEKIAVGDACHHDQDCGQISMPDGSGGWTTTNAAQCTNNMCECDNNNYVPDITGLYCATALTYGDGCMYSNTAVNSTVGVCDGSMGLRCGDLCDLDEYLGNGDYTCMCDPSYTDSSGTCTAKTVGSSCFGDLNCRAISDTAVCLDNLCAESGAGMAGISKVAAIAVMVVSWFMYM